MTLKELMKLKQKDWGMTQAEIASHIGVGYAFFSAILCGTTKLPEETLKTMLKRLDFSGCDERWLIAYFIRQSGKIPLSLLTSVGSVEAIIDDTAGNIIELYYLEKH